MYTLQNINDTGNHVSLRCKLSEEATSVYVR